MTHPSRIIQCKDVAYFAKRDVCSDGLYWEPDARTERATFGMNCFHSPEAIFGLIPGVIRTRVGFAGGSKLGPSSSMTFDYIESVDFEYDPRKVCYENLLDLFWGNHDPTQYVIRRYQSTIFYHTPEQKDLAEKSLRWEISNRARPIKTRIYPAKEFYEAEDCHQKFFLQKYPLVLCKLDPLVGPPLVRSKVAARLNGYLGGFGRLECFEGEWKNLGLCCEVVEFIRKVILLNYRPKIGC